MANAFFSDLLATISERGRSLLRRGEPAEGKEDASDLVELCESLLSGRGQARQSDRGLAGAARRRQWQQPSFRIRAAAAGIDPPPQPGARGYQRARLDALRSAHS